MDVGGIDRRDRKDADDAGDHVIHERGLGGAFAPAGKAKDAF
jgi:hypothetical protein